MEPDLNQPAAMRSLDARPGHSLRSRVNSSHCKWRVIRRPTIVPGLSSMAGNPGGRWDQLQLRTQGNPLRPAPGSLEESITEHYWGYTVQKDASCLEHQVEHPPWRIWRAAEAWLDCDVASLYGPQFNEALRAMPGSAFLAEGSPVTVHKGASVSLSRRRC